MKQLTLIILLLAATGLLIAEPLYLVQAPTAGILQKGEAQVSTNVYRNNGMWFGAMVGLFPRFMFGVNYGAEQLVGNQDPLWHDKVDVDVRLRIIDESPSMPAICVGINTQGHGAWDTDSQRYDIKSKGFYLALSRNFAFLGNLGLHAGGNYSLENKDEDKDPSCWIGLDKTVGDMITVAAEYDLAFNDNLATDNLTTSIDKADKGYLNAALNVTLTPELSLTLQFYDLLENMPSTKAMDRALKVNYRFNF